MEWETIDVLLRQHLNPAFVLCGLLVIAFVLFITLIAKDIRISIYIFLISVVFTGIHNEVIHTAFYVLRWLILALIIVRFLVHQTKIRFPLISLVFLFWVFLAYISGLQAYSLFRGLVFATVYALCFVVFFLFVLNELSSEDGIKKWFNLFLTLAWTFSLISIIAFIVEPSVYARGHGGRLTGIFANSASQARILLFSTSIFLWSGLNLQYKVPKQILYYFMTFVCLFLMLLAGSRGALAASVVMMVILFLRYRRKMAFMIIPLVVIGAFIVVPKVISTASKQYTEHLLSLEETHRPMLRELGVKLFYERPIRGWGLGSLSDLKSDVCPNFVSLHNLYLNWLVEFGLPGFLVAIFLWLYSYFRLWKFIFNKYYNEYLKNVAWFIIAWFSALILWGYTDTSIGDPSKLYFYWFFLLIILSENIIYIAKDLCPDCGSVSKLEYPNENYAEISCG